MSGLLPLPDLSNFERISSLLSIRDRLPSEGIKIRLYCLYHYSADKSRCETPLQRFYDDHPIIFNTARNILAQEVDSITKEDFICILRTFFCTDHDPWKTSSTEFRKRREYLENLWSSATRDTKNEVLNAFRNSGRGISSPPTPQRGTPQKIPGDRRTKSGKPRMKKHDHPREDEVESSPSAVDVDQPTRLRTPQAKLSHDTEHTASASPMPRPTRDSESDMHSRSHSPHCPDIPSPSPLLLPPGSASPFNQPPAEGSSPGSAQVPQPEFPLGEGDQSEPTIFDEPQARARAAAHSNLEEAASDGNNGPALNQHLQAEDPFTEPAKQHSTHNSVPEGHLHERTLPIRSRPPVTLNHAGKRIRVNLPPRPSVNFSKPPGDVPKLNVWNLPNPSVAFDFNWVPETKTPKPGCYKVAPPAESQDEDQFGDFLGPRPFFRKVTPSPAQQSQGEQSPAPQPLAPQSPAPQHEQNTHAFDIHRPETIARSIRKLLSDSFEEGVIYVLKAPRFFQSYEPAKGKQWVKIGITRDVKERIRDLKRECGFTDLTECFSSEGLVRMDLLRRMERVCHEELNNFRRTIQCKEGVNGAKCNTLHAEWFEVHEDVAIRTVKRWRKFLDYKPYEDDGRMSEFWRKRLYGSSYEFGTGEGELDHLTAHRRYESFLEQGYSVVEEGKERAGHV